MIKIERATKVHLIALAPLFNAYRIFYKQESDLAAAHSFLKERLTNSESIVFLAYYKEQAVGFTQLYKSFSSVSLQPLYILNDLYVDKTYRKKGIGQALLLAAQTLCKSIQYRGLALETAIDNPAQKLYERLGWKKDSECFHYFWSVS